jgi:hypothetical protein
MQKDRIVLRTEPEQLPPVKTTGRKFGDLTIYAAITQRGKVRFYSLPETRSIKVIRQDE